MQHYSLAPRVRLELIHDAELFYHREPIRVPGDIWHFLKDEARTWDRERFLVLALDARHRVLGIEEVSVGTVSASLVHPRECFKALLLANATAFVLVHNHPSGDPLPSSEDRTVTERLKRAAELLGLVLVDHVVLGSDGYYSFAEAGELL